MRVGEHDIMALHRQGDVELRGSTISMIFQEPMTALDPLYTIGDQIAETVMRHERVDRDAGWKRALELLELVRVPSPERRLKAYPHELSGGLRQRAMIAVALSLPPAACCSPTSRPPRSTPRCRSRCWSCCASCSARWACR